MTLDQFKKEISELLELEDEEFSMLEDFKAQDYWDSLSFLVLSTFIKDNFKLTVNRQFFNQFSSFQELYNYVCK
jgi:acyl carrier protein